MFKILATTVALSFAACAASAATLSIVGGTSGTIPGGTATNEALAPLGFPNPLAGYYGSAIHLVGNSTLKFERLGAEAGYTNKFIYTSTNPDLTLTDAGGGSFFDPDGIDSFTVSSVLEGLLGFKFKTSGGNLTVANGSNPDNTSPNRTPGINFFATFADLGNTRSGSVLYLFFDDDGANNDDNHDDLVIRISAVPLPAGGLLLIGAVGGLALLRRRKALAA